MPWFRQGLDKQGLHFANTSRSTSSAEMTQWIIINTVHIKLILSLFESYFNVQDNSSPLHSNFFAGVVRSSLPSMPCGPEQRAIPGSLYPVFTQSDSQRRWQLQYKGLAPIALNIKEKENFVKSLLLQYTRPPADVSTFTSKTNNPNRHYPRINSSRTKHLLQFNAS